jgi:hypothetical protein
MKWDEATEAQRIEAELEAADREIEQDAELFEEYLDEELEEQQG